MLNTRYQLSFTRGGISKATEGVASTVEGTMTVVQGVQDIKTNQLIRNRAVRRENSADAIKIISGAGIILGLASRLLK